MSVWNRRTSARGAEQAASPEPAASTRAPELYFPNQPGAAIDVEARLRAALKNAPQDLRLRVYAIFSALGPTYSSTTFTIGDGLVVAEQEGSQIRFPDPLPLVKHSHIVFGYEQWLQRKYSLPGFVEVEHGDVVIDCGAYVGGFSLSAARLAGRVHAFEPESRNFRCLTENMADRPNVICNLAALYSSSRIVRLNVSESSVEHSLLQPDDGDPVEVREVQAISLSDYCRDNRLTRLDFVKVEAEGVELEIHEGLGDVRPRKLAIDVSPERDGNSPAAEFTSRLADAGYEVRQRRNVLFARLP
jgi:FkbM family methyltransferase